MYLKEQKPVYLLKAGGKLMGQEGFKTVHWPQRTGLSQQLLGTEQPVENRLQWP